ncbi:hypothetical protein BJX66DRAFT_121970 [Aspergillus keveii]|uniref:Uncharacterized protein n=1 Tax=Aspergillus keveii TaxID=714993 RepID=A0ABR4FJZ2_9EURO
MCASRACLWGLGVSSYCFRAAYRVLERMGRHLERKGLKRSSPRRIDSPVQDDLRKTWRVGQALRDPREPPARQFSVLRAFHNSLQGTRQNSRYYRVL